MELLRKTVRVGNSAGVILPKKLLGCEVKVTVINQPLNLKKEVLKLLDSELDEIQGIYVITKNPIEILAVSQGMRKMLNEEKIKINIVPLAIVKRDISKIKPKLEKAEIILNKELLRRLLREEKL